VVAFAQRKVERGLGLAKIPHQRLGIVQQRAIERHGNGDSGTQEVHECVVRGMSCNALDGETV
jgi:hypothetical protein